MTLHHATAAKKREEEEYIPFLLCSGYLFVIFDSSSAEDIHYPMLQQIIFIKQFATDNEPSSVLCIVSCCVHCPAPPNDEGAPFVLSAVSCTALQYLHTIYSLSTLYLLSIHP